MFKILIIAGGLFFLYRLVMKPANELDSTDHNEIDPESNTDTEYTDYEEID